ncbi:YebG family protein [Rheinheimera pleomorphica]|uniref:YebG family protein n=1 Tax=Rheinheimera pleomorphica TaxID=2703963 RepID=UPI00141E21B4|nr:YebG family protein [Rheinheimera pleomorphica]
MAVIIKYVVERNGAEKMTFTSKAQADAYDKMLDTADALTTVLSQTKLLSDDNQTEALALYLAQHKDELLVALGAKKPAAKEKTPAEKTTKAKIAAVEQAA